jgi:hypothetical protein
MQDRFMLSHEVVLKFLRTHDVGDIELALDKRIER